MDEKDKRIKKLEQALRDIESHVNGHLSWYAHLTRDDAYYQACTKPAFIAREALKD